MASMASVIAEPSYNKEVTAKHQGGMNEDILVVDPMLEMSILDRSSSLSQILAAKTTTTQASTDPTVRSSQEILAQRRGKGLLNWILGRSGQSISEEERNVRKQALALRRVQSMEMLSPSSNGKITPRSNSRRLCRTKSNEILSTDPLVDLSINPPTFESELYLEDEHLESAFRSDRLSPGSPAFQVILDESVNIMESLKDSRSNLVEDCLKDLNINCDPHQVTESAAAMEKDTPIIVSKSPSRKASAEASLIMLGALLGALERVVPRRYSEQIAALNRRFSIIFEQEGGAEGNPIEVVESPKSSEAKLESLLERYHVLRKTSIVDAKEKPMVVDLLNEIDKIMSGLDPEEATRKKKEEEGDKNHKGGEPSIGRNVLGKKSKKKRKNSGPNLIDYENEPLPSPANKSNQTLSLPRDLSHELLSQMSLANSPHNHDSYNDSIAVSPNFPTFGLVEDLKSPIASPPPSAARINSPGMLSQELSPLSLSRAEMGYYYEDNVLSSPSLSTTSSSIIIMERLMPYIQANHHVCMQHNRTAIPKSLDEISLLLLNRYAESIDLHRESSDPKHLFLVPLGDNCVPRWIPPGARFRIGRNSSWLQAKSRVISRNHCEIFHDINSYFLADVGSSSGTFLNGMRVTEVTKGGESKLLASGDIIQIGLDYQAEVDKLGNLELPFQCVQALVLLGYPTKATVATKGEAEALTPIIVEPKSMLMDGEMQKGSSHFIKWSQLQKAMERARKFPSLLEGGNVRIYMETGDILHDDGAGLAIVFLEGVAAYSAVFNNYKLCWEVALTDTTGTNTIVLDALANSTTAYSVMRGNDDLGRITAVTLEKMVIDPSPLWSVGRRESETWIGPSSPIFDDTIKVTPSDAIASPTDRVTTILPPFYTMAGDLKGERGGFAYFLQRSHQDRRQTVLGEAQITSKRSRWGRRRHLLEARMVFPKAHQSLIILGTLLMALLQLEKK